MKKLIIFCYCCCIFGCKMNPSNNDDYPHYFRDKRTNLCYAAIGSPVADNFAFTNVPCSPEVEKLIEIQNK